MKHVHASIMTSLDKRATISTASSQLSSLSLHGDIAEASHIFQEILGATPAASRRRAALVAPISVLVSIFQLALLNAAS